MSTPIWLGTTNTTWSTAGNWSTAAVPVNSDTAVLTGSNVSIDAGLTQNTVTLTAFNMDMSYTGLVGTAASYLYIGSTTFNLGLPVIGTGTTGSRRMNIRAANSGAAINIFNTATSSFDTGFTPVRLLCTSAALAVSGGTVGVALYAGETSTVSTLSMTSGAGTPTVVLGAGNTLTTGTINAGTLINSATAATTTLTLNNGTLEHNGSGGYTTLTLQQGVVANYNGTGTIGTLNLTGTIDFSGGTGAVTVTNCNAYRGAKIIDPLHRVTFTNPFTTVQCKLTDVSVNLGYNKSYQVS